MNYTVSWRRACAITPAALLLAALAGCGGNGAPTPPPVTPASAVARALADHDANKDGAFDAKELDRCPGLKALCAALGKAEDRLTGDELTRQLEALRAGAGRMRAACRVWLDGRPLAGAAVRYVPEPFLGPDFKPALGTTDAAGYAALTTEGQADGVVPGLYRVEVSKKNAQGRETVPARYNAATTLGCPVGLETRGAGGDVVFQLKR